MTVCGKDSSAVGQNVTLFPLEHCIMYHQISLFLLWSVFRNLLEPIHMRDGRCLRGKQFATWQLLIGCSKRTTNQELPRGRVSLADTTFLPCESALALTEFFSFLKTKLHVYILLFDCEVRFSLTFLHVLRKREIYYGS